MGFVGVEGNGGTLLLMVGRCGTGGGVEGVGMIFCTLGEEDGGCVARMFVGGEGWGGIGRCGGGG